MRILPALILIAFLAGCDSSRKAIAPGEASEEQAGAIAQESSEVGALETDSFRLGNKEIRDEVLDLFEKEDIRYTLNDDNLITIFLVDGDRVDKIYTDVRLTYIRRN